MAKLPQPGMWLSEEDFSKENPITGNITAVEKELNLWKREVYVLYIRFKEGLKDSFVRKFTLLQDNYAKLWDKFGDDSGSWIGRTITIQSRAVETKEGIKHFRDVMF